MHIYIIFTDFNLLCDSFRYLPVFFENDLVLTPPSDSSLLRHMISGNHTVLSAQLNRIYTLEGTKTLHHPLTSFARETRK